MGLTTYLLSCFYFYLPAAMANIGANLGKFIPFFKSIKKPIDFNIKIKGERLIGDHKNFGSFAFGILFGSSFGYIKSIYIDQFIPDHFLLFHLNLQLNILLYILMSIAALSGDVLKSLIKRLLNKPPHSSWMPFDQIDHSVTSLFIASLIVPIEFIDIFTIIVMYALLHICTNLLAYLLGIKSVPH